MPLSTHHQWFEFDIGKKIWICRKRIIQGLCHRGGRINKWVYLPMYEFVYIVVLTLELWQLWKPINSTEEQGPSNHPKSVCFNLNFIIFFVGLFIQTLSSSLQKKVKPFKKYVWGLSNRTPLKRGKPVFVYARYTKSCTWKSKKRIFSNYASINFSIINQQTDEGFTFDFNTPTTMMWRTRCKSFKVTAPKTARASVTSAVWKVSRKATKASYHPHNIKVNVSNFLNEKHFPISK
jgi:hypothetical protein